MKELTLKQIYNSLKEDDRIQKYDFYEKLYLGDHFSAFSIKSEDFKTEYARLRYIVCNFAGLVSKVMADMLFGEPVSFKDEENQEFIDALVFENNLNTLFYEHSLANSYFGDNIFKIRVEDNVIKIEDSPPALYLPELDSGNTRAKPKRSNLVWKHTVGDDKYIVVESHEPPLVKTRVGRIAKKGEAVVDIDVETFNKLADTNYIAEVDTKINRPLVIHVPNYKARGYFGISDFIDIQNLVFALNNRMSKVDNILDRHSDPILAIPDGVLDEEGTVRKEALTMFEMDEAGNKPEYIVWNANLDSAMKEIDKMVEFLFMFSETSPDALGLGKGGQAESGRALKMKLLRTISKRNRKKIYYDQAIKDLIFTAELLAKANGYVVSNDFKNIKPSTPKLPETKWQDGVVNDEVERMDIIVKKLEAGVTSEKRAIMEIEDVKEEEADEILKEIGEENEKKADFTSFVDNPKKEDKPDKGNKAKE